MFLSATTQQHTHPRHTVHTQSNRLTPKEEKKDNAGPQVSVKKTPVPMFLSATTQQYTHTHAIQSTLNLIDSPQRKKKKGQRQPPSKREENTSQILGMGKVCNVGADFNFNHTEDYQAIYTGVMSMDIFSKTSYFNSCFKK
ncbi:hypothetical protein M8J77_001849 [Diaphorina citri]|nr:hypothetical protein M8J77_001849 [Diaphorina citri]